MPARIALPLKIKDSGTAFWIEDAEGRRFSFAYYRERPIVGTDGNQARLDKGLAMELVKEIARLLTDARKP